IFCSSANSSISIYAFFFSSRRRHTRFSRDWSSDVCSSDLLQFRASGEFAGRDAEMQLIDQLLERGGGAGAVDLERDFHRRGFLRSEKRRVGEEWRKGLATFEYKKTEYEDTVRSSDINLT